MTFEREPRKGKDRQVLLCRETSDPLGAYRLVLMWFCHPLGQ